MWSIRIIESLRLKMTSKIIWSNHSPISDIPHQTRYCSSRPWTGSLCSVPKVSHPFVLAAQVGWLCTRKVLGYHWCCCEKEKVRLLNRILNPQFSKSCCLYLLQSLVLLQCLNSLSLWNLPHDSQPVGENECTASIFCLLLHLVLRID